MCKKILIAVCSLFLMLFLSSDPFAAPVPDTGQTRCYDVAGNEITCPQPGERFYVQDGNYTINPMSFTKLESQGNTLPDSATYWGMIKGFVLFTL